MATPSQSAGIEGVQLGTIDKVHKSFSFSDKWKQVLTGLAVTVEVRSLL